MMHNHDFPAVAGADELPTIEKLWEEAKAARQALIFLPPHASEAEAEPYYQACNRAEGMIERLWATTASEIAIHLRIYFMRNEQSAWGEHLAVGIVPHNDWAAILPLSPESVPVWKLICELEGRPLP